MTKDEIYALVELGTEDSARKIWDSFQRIERCEKVKISLYGFIKDYWPGITGLALLFALIWCLIVGSSVETEKEEKTYLSCIKNADLESCGKHVANHDAEQVAKDGSKALLDNLLKKTHPPQPDLSH